MDCRVKPGNDGGEASDKIRKSRRMIRNYLPARSRARLIAALIACAVDQASKLYLLFVFDLAHNGPVRLGPFFDLVLTRNTGISYGLFQTQGALGGWVLLGTKVLAVALLLDMAGAGAGAG